MYSEQLIRAAPKSFNGKPHQLLMDLAEAHAEFMAIVDKQGHQHFQSRYDEIKAKAGLRAIEICAESWAWEQTVEDAAVSMWKSWFYHLHGHRDVCITPHDFYGAAMAKGKVWYACIIVGDKS